MAVAPLNSAQYLAAFAETNPIERSIIVATSRTITFKLDILTSLVKSRSVNLRYNSISKH